MNTTEKLLKRRCCEVTCNGEVFHVRGLTMGDRRRLDKLEDVIAKSFYTLGRGICEGDGSDSFPLKPGESDAEYAARIESTVQEIDSETLAELTIEIQRVSRTPKQATIEKN